MEAILNLGFRFSLMIILAVGSINNLQAQTPAAKTVIITITSTDQDGNTTIEKIEKSGVEASEEAIDQIVQDALKSNKAVDIEVEQTEKLAGDKGITKTIERHANRKTGEEEMELEIQLDEDGNIISEKVIGKEVQIIKMDSCLLYTSPSPRDATLSRMPSSA